MPGHVADHHADAVAREAVEVVEVAAHVLGGHDARRDGRLGRDVRRVGQELHLQVVRELHLLLEALLVERLPHEPRVLDGRADLARDGRDELLVARGEGLPGAAVGEVHDAERLAAVLRRPEDGHGEHRAAPERRAPPSQGISPSSTITECSVRNTCALTLHSSSRAMGDRRECRRRRCAR